MAVLSRLPRHHVHSDRYRSLTMRKCLTCYRKTRNPRFCSRRCAAIMNNHLFPKRRPLGQCSRCRKRLTTHRGICDTCRSRMDSWLVKAPEISSLWTAAGRKLALDFVGLGLWWGEGTKDRQTVAVANADPDAILLALKWLREVYGVPLRKFRISLAVHHDVNVRATRHFWSRLTGIPLSQFRKTMFYRTRQKHPSRLMPYGTCVIRLHDVRLFDQVNHRLRAIRRLIRSSDSRMFRRQLAMKAGGDWTVSRKWDRTNASLQSQAH